MWFTKKVYAKAFAQAESEFNAKVDQINADMSRCLKTAEAFYHLRDCKSPEQLRHHLIADHDVPPQDAMHDDLLYDIHAKLHEDDLKTLSEG